MSYMFDDATINIPKCVIGSTGNVTNMTSMFVGDAGRRIPDVSQWDVSNVEFMQIMFSGHPSSQSRREQLGHQLGVGHEPPFQNAAAANPDAVSVEHW